MTSTSESEVEPKVKKDDDYTGKKNPKEVKKGKGNEERKRNEEGKRGKEGKRGEEGKRG